MSSQQPRKREYHYRFVHEILPNFIQISRVTMLRGFMSADPQQALTNLWKLFDNTFREEERIGTEGLSCSRYDFNEHQIVLKHLDSYEEPFFYPNFKQHAIVIFTFPPPLAMTEAYFSAVVYAPIANVTREDLPSLPYRYFTIEKSFHLDGTDAPPYLCEWRNGNHLNFEVRPEPTEEAFLKAIKLLMKQNASDVAAAVMFNNP